MNDRWIKKGGGRWNSAERDRVTHRFRSYVRSPSNPTGRIHREKCWFCRRERIKQGWDLVAIESILPNTAAHHLDYSQPFVVVWVCESHHQQIDHGTPKVPGAAIFDYTSLVAPLVRPELRGNTNARRKEEEAELEEAPF